jgi:hypothetical protein
LDYSYDLNPEKNKFKLNPIVSLKRNKEEKMRLYENFPSETCPNESFPTKVSQSEIFPKVKFSQVLNKQ